MEGGVISQNHSQVNQKGKVRSKGNLIQTSNTKLFKIHTDLTVKSKNYKVSKRKHKRKPVCRLRLGKDLLGKTQKA